MPLSISTDLVAPGERVEYWRRCLRETFDIDCCIVSPSDASFDARLVSYSAGAVRFVETLGLPFTLNRKAHEDCASFFVHVQLEGNCSYRERGLEARLEPGSFCLSRVRRAAEIEWHDAFRCVVIGIPENRLTEACPDWSQFAATRISGSEGAAAIFVNTVRSLLANPKALSGSAAKGVGEALIGLLGAALGEIADQNECVDTRLETYHKARIHKFIRAELSNPELDIPLIAQSVGLSQRYIHRLFVTEPLHLMQSVWWQRLEHCYRELTQNQTVRRPISDVAYSWGFNDPAHFSRVFRKRYGLTPSDLRQQARRPQANVPDLARDTFDQAIFQS
jgi:AraC family transcriptional activator of tynA and feaB